MKYFQDTQKLTEAMNTFYKQMKLYNILTPSFPFDACSYTSSKLYKKYGFPIVDGLYCGEFDDKFREMILKKHPELKDDFKEIPHRFSYVPELGFYVDASPRQFHASNQEILIMPKNDKRISLGRKTEDSNTHIVNGVFAYATDPRIATDRHDATGKTKYIFPCANRRTESGRSVLHYGPYLTGMIEKSEVNE